MTVDEQGRPEPPMNTDEAGTTLGFLDFHRATLAWKCDGLDAAGLNTTIGSSTMTLGGMLKHLAFVEDFWFGYRMAGREPAPPWDTADWDADPDWDWHSAARDSPQELHRLWREAVQRSRDLVTELMADDGDLAQVAKRPFADGGAVSLRWVLVHMVEEYARHNGHADLLRESVDGLTGE